MAKRQKLTLQQKRRVAKSQRKKSEQPLEFPDDLGPIENGIVISRFGEQADIADNNRQVLRAYLRQNLGSCVAGDRVSFRRGSDIAVIESISERSSELNRPTRHSGIKTIVANIDQIMIVVAPYPEYSAIILDRYLVACELAKVTPHIIFNKMDLVSAEQEAFFAQQINLYRTIGYQVFPISCQTQTGISELTEQFLGQESILVGQSGVGKSSLINTLLPDADMAVGEVSENSRLGTHTTTASRLFFLPQNGHIIDSPGVREFGLSHIDADTVINGFRDLLPYSGQCKFRNCRHINETGCAVLAAAKEALIDPQRLTSFHSILRSIDNA